MFVTSSFCYSFWREDDFKQVEDKYQLELKENKLPPSKNKIVYFCGDNMGDIYENLPKFAN